MSAMPALSGIEESIAAFHRHVDKKYLEELTN